MTSMLRITRKPECFQWHTKSLFLRMESCIIPKRWNFSSSATRIRLQKSNYMASAGKAGGEEKWGQVAMEYIYEMNHTVEPGKRQSDVDLERRLSTAMDRYLHVNEKILERRMSRLSERMSEALETLQILGLEDTLEEASMLNTEQPPLNFRRPSLTPPLAGYEPGFGMDVPQLKSQQMEYPPVKRVTDHLEFNSSEASEKFPYVEAYNIEDLTKDNVEQLDTLCGEIREAYPMTGVEGEAWAAHLALERKALARQKLILDLAADSSFKEMYDKDDAFRHTELQKRGILELSVDVERERHEERHFAHEPAYQPFRQ